MCQEEEEYQKRLIDQDQTVFVDIFAEEENPADSTPSQPSINNVKSFKECIEINDGVKRDNTFFKDAQK